MKPVRDHGHGIIHRILFCSWCRARFMQPCIHVQQVWINIEVVLYKPPAITCKSLEGHEVLDVSGSWPGTKGGNLFRTCLHFIPHPHGWDTWLMSKSMACLRGQLHSFSVQNPQNKQFHIPRQTWHWQRRLKCLKIQDVQRYITFWKVLDSFKMFVGVIKADLMWVVLTRFIFTSYIYILDLWNGSTDCGEGLSSKLRNYMSFIVWLLDLNIWKSTASQIALLLLFTTVVGDVKGLSAFASACH